MKVFNITDGSTAALRNQHLDNQHIRVGDIVVPPGGSADIRGTAKERSELTVLVKMGAVALDELPAAYAAKRGLNVDGSPIPVEAPPAPVAPKETEVIQEDPGEGRPQDSRIPVRKNR